MASPSMADGAIELIRVGSVTDSSDHLAVAQHVTSDHHNTSAQDPKTSAKHGRTEWPLRYAKRSIWLLAFYACLLVVPWTLTCVLTVKPLNLPSYINQATYYSPADLASVEISLAAVRVLNSIASVLTVPIVSGILAHAAIVYTQRRNAKQTLNVQQLLALADKGWSDPLLLWRTTFWKSSSGGRSPFLWFASGLMLLCVVQQPIQQLVVRTIQFLVPTCNDNPYFILSNDSTCDWLGLGHVSLGYDPEPAALAIVPQNIIVQDIIRNIITVSGQNVQLHLWPEQDYSLSDVMTSNRNSLYWYSTNNASYFVSALPNRTTTGVLRQHAMRMNSSVKCASIARSDFPSACTGSRPFTASFSNAKVGDLSTPSLDIRVCAPGDFSSPPWNLSRDRQDINEELFIDVYVLNATYEIAYANFTVHCTSQTTRGYFELGNYQNDYTAGPLLSTWPDDNDMKSDFNDYLSLSVMTTTGQMFPSSIDPDPNVSTGVLWGTVPDFFYTYDLTTPGPLMTSAIAIFGNQSFFYLASNSTTSSNSSASSMNNALAAICQEGTIPFLRLDYIYFNSFTGYCAHQSNDGYIPGDIVRLLYLWIENFIQTDAAEKALDASIFFANQAYLTQTADATRMYSAREIFTGNGLQVSKPVTSLASIIIISVMIFLQLLGLLLVIKYIYSVPTWESSFDALALLRLGASIGAENLPSIGPVKDKDMLKLKKTDGLVGIEDIRDREIDETSFNLGLGAQGLITRQHGLKKEKKKIGKIEKTTEEKKKEHLYLGWLERLLGNATGTENRALIEEEEQVIC